MPVNEKGLYPEWMTENDIITLLLRQIISRGGEVPYTFAVNPEQAPETQERMKKIIGLMLKYKLLAPMTPEHTMLELGVAAGPASRIGFKKYKRKQNLKQFYSGFIRLIFKYYIPIIIVIIAIIILHYLKVL